MGMHIVEQLLKSGNHSITAITRPESSSRVPEGVKVARVDYTNDDDDAGLVEVLQGQEALIVTMSLQAPRDTVAKLMRAADRAGVRYIMPNWFGHDSANDSLVEETMLGEMRRSILDIGKTLSVSSYILLVCNFWYEFSLGGGSDRFGFNFKDRELILFGDGTVSINVTTWTQCGRAIANLFSLKELPESETDESPTISRFRNKEVYVSSFCLSQRDMFKSVRRVTKTGIDDWKLSHESVRERWTKSQALVKQGDFSAFPRMLYSRTFFPNGGGEYESTRGLDNGLLGLPEEDVDECTAVAVRLGETWGGELANEH